MLVMAREAITYEAKMLLPWALSERYAMAMSYMAVTPLLWKYYYCCFYYFQDMPYKIHIDVDITRYIIAYWVELWAIKDIYIHSKIFSKILDIYAIQDIDIIHIWRSMAIDIIALLFIHVVMSYMLFIRATVVELLAAPWHTLLLVLLYDMPFAMPPWVFICHIWALPPVDEAANIIQEPCYAAAYYAIYSALVAMAYW